MSIFFLILVMGILIVSSILGILRIFMVGASVAAMPLLLVLRLIPLTRRVAESFIEVSVGLMLGSLMAAIFIRFGWEVVRLWGGIPSLITSIATLMAAALMPTVLAPRLGTLFLVGAGIASHAVSTAVSGATIVAFGTTVGAATGAYGALKAGLGSRSMARAALMGGASGLSKGWLRAVSGRAPTFRAARYFHVPALGEAADVGALTGLQAGVEKALEETEGPKGVIYIGESGSNPKTLREAIIKASERRAGSILEALTLQYISADPHPKATVERGLAHQLRISGMEGREAALYILGFDNPIYKRLRRRGDEVGSSLKKIILNLPPLRADSYIIRMRSLSGLKGSELRTEIAKSLRGYDKNLNQLKRIMALPNIAATAADDLLIHWGGSDLLSGTTTEHGLKEQKRISMLTGEEVLDELYGGTPIVEEIPAGMRREIGEKIKRTILNVPPIIASNIIARAHQYRTFPKPHQRAIMEEAEKLRSEKEEIFRAYVSGMVKPDMERMDNSLHYAIDLFNPGTLTLKGRTAMAKLFEAAKTFWNPDADLNKGLDFIRKCREKYTENPVVLGRYIANITDVELTSQEAEKFGHAFWQLIKNADKDEKKLLILSNVAEGTEKHEWKKLMKDNRFTVKAVKNVDNYETQAWIANEIFCDASHESCEFN